jgi:hypothetical protein
MNQVQALRVATRILRERYMDNGDHDAFDAWQSLKALLLALEYDQPAEPPISPKSESGLRGVAAAVVVGWLNSDPRLSGSLVPDECLQELTNRVYAKLAEQQR